MLTRIATLFALGVFRVLGCLPLSALQSIGSGLGWFFWMIPGTYKRRAAANIALAYPDASPTMLREVLQQGLRMIMELPYLWAPKNAAKLNQLIRCDDWSLIDDALAQGNGLILISPHIGCFEMLGPFFSQRHPATVIFKEPRMKWLSNLIHQVRVTPQLTLVPASQRGVKGLVKTLLKGQTIGFLPDQVPTYGEGVLAPFFGKDAYTLTLVQRMQSLRDSPIFTVGLERLDHGKGYRLHVQPMSQALSSDPLTAATQMNQALESMIRKMPTQYLWGYNRYKKPCRLSLQLPPERPELI